MAKYGSFFDWRNEKDPEKIRIYERCEREAQYDYITRPRHDHNEEKEDGLTNTQKVCLLATAGTLATLVFMGIHDPINAEHIPISQQEYIDQLIAANKYVDALNCMTIYPQHLDEALDKLTPELVRDMRLSQGANDKLLSAMSQKGLLGEVRKQHDFVRSLNILAFQSSDQLAKELEKLTPEKVEALKLYDGANPQLIKAFVEKGLMTKAAKENDEKIHGKWSKELSNAQDAAHRGKGRL